MAVPHSASLSSGTEPNLLLEWPGRRSRSGWFAILGGSIALHLVLFVLATQVPGLVGASAAPVSRPVVHRTILYFPQQQLTQKAPNTQKPNRNIDLQSLLSAGGPPAHRPSPAKSVRHFEVPKFAQPMAAPKAAPQIVAQAPVMPTSPTAAPSLPGANAGLPPSPPEAAPVNQPFQNLGSDQPVQRPDKPAIAIPKATVQGAIQSLTQAPNSQRLVITDDNSSSAAPGSSGAPGRTAAQHSAVELESDPLGADFRAYLAQILSIVRHNWRRVTPESVQMGTLRGRTVVQFIISRDGSIPKLVIATPSNIDALDRASVAGLSMSNPLPPLPTEFKGSQVRLAFTFSYNMPAQ